MKVTKLIKLGTHLITRPVNSSPPETTSVEKSKMTIGVNLLTETRNIQLIFKTRNTLGELTQSSVRENKAVVIPMCHLPNDVTIDLLKIGYLDFVKQNLEVLLFSPSLSYILKDQTTIHAIGFTMNAHVRIKNIYCCPAFTTAYLNSREKGTGRIRYTLEFVPDMVHEAFHASMKRGVFLGSLDPNLIDPVINERNAYSHEIKAAEKIRGLIKPIDKPSSVFITHLNTLIDWRIKEINTYNQILGYEKGDLTLRLEVPANYIPEPEPIEVGTIRLQNCNLR